MGFLSKTTVCALATFIMSANAAPVAPDVLAPGTSYALQFSAPRSPLDKTFVQLGSSTNSLSSVAQPSGAARFSARLGADGQTYEMLAASSAGSPSIAGETVLALQEARADSGMWKMTVGSSSNTQGALEWQKWKVITNRTDGSKTLGYGIEGKWVAVPKTGNVREYDVIYQANNARVAMIQIQIPVTIKLVVANGPLVSMPTAKGSTGASAALGSAGFGVESMPGAKPESTTTGTTSTGAGFGVESMPGAKPESATTGTTSTGSGFGVESMPGAKGETDLVSVTSGFGVETMPGAKGATDSAPETSDSDVKVTPEARDLSDTPVDTPVTSSAAVGFGVEKMPTAKGPFGISWGSLGFGVEKMPTAKAAPGVSSETTFFGVEKMPTAKGATDSSSSSLNFGVEDMPGAKAESD